MTGGSRRAAEFDGAYSLHEYAAMFADPARARAYVAALEAAIREGTVMVDLGAGPGLFSLLACRLGARRVYAIEASPAVELARWLAADNGFAERIVCYEALSSEVTLPERADVLLADLRGAMPFFERAVESVIDARTRFLKPGGTIIPRRDTLWAAVVHAPHPYDSVVRPWTENAHGLDLHRGLHLAVNEWISIGHGKDTPLSEPVSWAAIDYASVSTAAVTGTAACPVTRAGAAHGVVAWFDSEFGDGIVLSNAPENPGTVYGRAFFPWPTPHELQVGDTVVVNFRVLPGAGDPVWTWETSIRDRHGEERAAHRQSTFFGQILPAADRERRAHPHVPVLSADGQIERDTLVAIDGRRTLGEIATLLREKYPEVFDTWEQALDRAADVSGNNEQRDVGPR